MNTRFTTIRAASTQQTPQNRQFQCAFVFALLKSFFIVSFPDSRWSDVSPVQTSVSQLRVAVLASMLCAKSPIRLSFAVVFLLSGLFRSREPLEETLRAGLRGRCMADELVLSWWSAMRANKK